MANVDQLLALKEKLVNGTQRRLTSEQFETLSLLCRQMAAFYPHQELSPDTVQGYMSEFERIAVKHGIDHLQSAFMALRSKPGQRFFPHPSEVREEIEDAIHIEREQGERTRQESRADRERRVAIREFWTEIVPDRMERFGWSEEEALQRFPSFRGTKPGQSHAQKPNVVSMPMRDGKRAAAGDSDDAA
jgi:hypothetical protein